MRNFVLVGSLFVVAVAIAAAAVVAYRRWSPRQDGYESILI